MDSSAFSSVSGDFLTTSFSIPESAVWNETSNVVQTNSAQWGQGGGGSVSSKYGTITVDGNDIEATNKALEFKSNGFTSAFDNNFVTSSAPAVLNWDSYSQETNIHVNAFNTSNETGTLTYSSNTNVTGEVTAALNNSIDFNIQTPNATAIQFTTDISFQLSTIEVTAPSSFKVSELAWKSDLPTYAYDSNRKVSAINGSALVGNEDYLVEQGFVQNLTSPKGTISVLNNNKIEGTNSAIASDVIEGFVSAYNGLSVYPGNSATLSWSNYLPNTVLHVSGAQWYPTTFTYSADTGVTGQISLPNEGETSIEVPTNSTSIVIGTESWSNINLNFTVSAADYYEIGELAWASAIPTYEYDSTNKISAINGSAIAGGNTEVSHDNTLSGNGTVDSPLGVVPGYNETVLFETTSTSGSPMTDTFNLSGSMADFERIKILYRPWNDSIIPEWFEFDYNKRNNNLMRRATTFTINPLRFIVCEFNFSADNSFVVNDVRFADSSFTTTTLDKSRGDIWKIVGINRIANR